MATDLLRPPAPRPPQRQRGGSGRAGARLLAWVGALAALGAVFAAYLSPHLVVELAGRFWSCL